MLGWLVDNAVFLYVLLGFAAVLLLVLWWQNRTRRYLIALGVVAFLAALVFLLTLFVVSDRQVLVRTVTRMADDLEKHRAAEFSQNVAKSFRHSDPPMDAKEFREFVARNLKAFKVKTFHVGSFKVDKLVPRDKAKVSFHIRVELDAFREANVPPMRCESEFVWENERWCLQGFKLFPVGLGNEFHLSQFAK
jgi:hypothetical protein